MISFLFGWSLVCRYVSKMRKDETIDFACRLCVNQWWVARRGVAVGVLNMVGAFQSTLPAMIAVATRELGWRATLRAMAVMMGSAALGLSALLLQRPEDVGLRPDGADPSAPALPSGVKVLTRAARARAEAAAAAAPDSPAPRPLAHTHEESATEHELSVREAVRTTGFWLLFLYYLLCGGSWNALNFWMGSLLAELAAEVTSASARSLIYVPLAVASAAAALVGGVLVDRLRVPHKQLGLAAPTVCLALCLAAFGSGRKVHAAQLLAVGVGLGCYQGFDKTIPPVVAASLFGRRNNGRIEAVFLLTRQLSGAVGVQVLHSPQPHRTPPPFSVMARPCPDAARRSTVTGADYLHPHPPPPQPLESRCLARPRRRPAPRERC